MKNAITKFEQANGFSLQPFIASKTDFEVIKGFHDAFLHYKTEIEQIEQRYLYFFEGNGYNKIDPEYMRVVWNVNRFLELLALMNTHFQSVMSPQNHQEFAHYLADMNATKIACQHFCLTHRQDFNLYNDYFIRLQDASGFNEESYITFKEFRDNYAALAQLELESFKHWVWAQRISGKLGEN